MIGCVFIFFDLSPVSTVSARDTPQDHRVIKTAGGQQRAIGRKRDRHCQAVCACATYLLDRVRSVLRDGRPYELYDIDGAPLTWQEARAIIAERYHVT